MRLGRRDVAALAAVAAIVCGTVWFLRRIHTAGDQPAAASIVQGELAPLAIALVLLPLVWAWWRAKPSRRGSLRFAGRYRAFVRQMTHAVDARGLVTTPEYPISLDTVFVDVQVAPSPAGTVPTGLLSADDARTRRSIWDFVDGPDPTVAALIGGPGTGKTTLLRHVARTLAGARRRRVPVLLELRRHADEINADAPLWQLWRTSIGELAEREPRDWLRRRLERGRCVVLLDGLDEVPADHADHAARDWVQRQVHQYPRNDFLVTSRPHDYRLAPVTGATTLETRSLTDEQVRDFVDGMYRALPPANGDPAAVAGNLLARLSSRPDLYEFTANPLLLTMMVLAHRQGGALPENRAELYANVCTGVLSRRPGSHDVEATQAALAALAFDMSVATVNEVSAGDAAPALLPVTLREVAVNGLLVEVRRGRYAFAHRSFQEYLTVRHIVDKGLEQVLVDAVGEPWWRETQLLYATGSDPSTLLRACIETDTPDALSLAFECAAAATHVEPDVRARLDETVAAAFRDGADREYRRLIAGILLRYRLNPSLPAGDGRRVYARPVPQDLYWLFLKDTQTPHPDGGQPAPLSSAPVTGVWPSDAETFVAWANGLGVRVDLTAGTDLDSLRDRPVLATHHYWGPSTPGDPPLHRWTTSGAEDPLSVSTADLSARIREDGKAAQDLLTALFLLHARTLFRTAAAVRASGDDLATRAASRRYGDCGDLLLTLLARGIEDETILFHLAEARLAQRGDAPTLLTIEKALAAAGSGNKHLAVLEPAAGQAHVDTGEMARLADQAVTAMSRAESAAIHRAHSRGRSPTAIRIGTDQEILDRFINNNFGRFTSAQACYRSVSGALGDGVADMMRLGLLLDDDPLRCFVTTAIRDRPEATDVVLDSLPECLAMVRGAVARVDAPVLQVLGSRLHHVARPIVARQTASGADTARLYALVIGVEARDRHDRQLSEAAWQLAAGITLLQDRASGARPGEALFLTAT